MGKRRVEKLAVSEGKPPQTRGAHKSSKKRPTRAKSLDLPPDAPSDHSMLRPQAGCCQSNLAGNSSAGLPSRFPGARGADVGHRPARSLAMKRHKRRKPQGGKSSRATLELPATQAGGPSLVLQGSRNCRNTKMARISQIGNRPEEPARARNRKNAHRDALAPPQRRRIAIPLASASPVPPRG